MHAAHLHLWATLASLFDRLAQTHEFISVLFSAPNTALKTDFVTQLVGLDLCEWSDHNGGTSELLNSTVDSAFSPHRDTPLPMLRILSIVSIEHAIKILGTLGAYGTG